MSIYKEPPPGMFVVPDTVDMTKVWSLVAWRVVEGGRETGSQWLEEPKRIIQLPSAHEDKVKTPKE